MVTRIVYVVLAFFCSVNALQAQDTARVSLLFLGDIMQHESQLQGAYDSRTGRYDYAECFRLMKSYFTEADITIGNLEVTLGGKPFTGYPQFSAPDELAVALRDAGVDVLVTANNHSVDRRKKGLERTIRILDSLGIQHTGTFRDSAHRAAAYPMMMTKYGMRIALLNYTYGTNGIPITKPNIVNLIDTAQIRVDLAAAKHQLADAIVVFMHWGDEYQLLPNRDQKNLASFCFRNGATLVIGAHPHVLQPMEWNPEANQLVVYSLGNFVSGQRTRNRDGGAMLQVTMQTVITDSIRSTSIIDPGYRLQWVYRTPAGANRFRVMPVSTTESKRNEFVREETAREAYRIFADDSRRHLNTHNRNIREITSAPADSVVRYTVLLANDSISDTHKSWLVFGHDWIPDQAKNVRLCSGNFTAHGAALRYREKLVSVYPEGSVVKVVNGMIVSD
jgi:poly-gamma-glutamate capsule biosynthesis protein CapA/YwtB (metallophosphatase superfamily)